MGLIVYIRDSEKIELKNIYSEESEDKREKIARLVCNKRAKFTWSNPDYSAGQIRTAFEKRTINLNEIKYVKLADIAYIPLRSECVAHKQPIAIKSKRGT